MEAKTRCVKELGQVNNRSVHGQDQYRAWHVITVWFRTGQDRSKSLAAQIQAGTRQDQGQAQYKAVQVEPTRETLEPDPSKGTVQAYVKRCKKKIQKPRPEAGTALRKDLVGPA